MTEPRQIPICRYCSSPNLVFDATATYNYGTQCFEHNDTLEGAYCNACDTHDKHPDWVELHVFEIVSDGNKNGDDTEPPILMVMAVSLEALMEAMGGAPRLSVTDVTDHLHLIDLDEDIDFYLPADAEALASKLKEYAK